MPGHCGNPVKQPGLRENLGKQFFDFAVCAWLRVADTIERLDRRPEESAHEVAVLFHVICNQDCPARHEQGLDGFEDNLFLAQGDLVENQAAHDLVGSPSFGQLEVAEKTVVPFDEIGSCAEFAAGNRERSRVGFDTDQPGFRTIRHQGLEKGAGPAAHIDDPVARREMQMFDDVLSPEIFAGEYTDCPVGERRKEALAKKRRKFAVIFRCGDIAHGLVSIHPGFDPILTDPSRLRMAVDIPSKKEV